MKQSAQLIRNRQNNKQSSLMNELPRTVAVRPHVCVNGRRKSTSVVVRLADSSAAACCNPQISRLTMACSRNRSNFVKLHVILSFLISNCRLYAAVLTYDGCMSDGAQSYKVGGWCFLFYRNSSWANNVPTQDGAQSACLPHGNLAVGVTYKMMDFMKTQYTSTSQEFVWLALSRNASSGNSTSGLNWKTLLPTGEYATFPAILSNVPWATGEPNNLGGNENYAIMKYNVGVMDAINDMGGYGSWPMAVICQFAPLQLSFSPKGHGLLQVPEYRIAQTTAVREACILQCHRSVFCISLAFSPTTNDCQIYAVSPEDPRFAGNVTVNGAYEFYIRDGMEY